MATVLSDHTLYRRPFLGLSGGFGGGKPAVHTVWDDKSGEKRGRLAAGIDEMPFCTVCGAMFRLTKERPALLCKRRGMA